MIHSETLVKMNKLGETQWNIMLVAVYAVYMRAY